MILEKRLIRILAVVLGVIIGTRLFGGGVIDTVGPTPQSTKQVLVEQVGLNNLVPTINLPASILAASQLDLTPMVSGEITAVNFSEGDYIIAGQDIFTVEQDQDSVYQNAVTQAGIGLDSAQSSLNSLLTSYSEDVKSLELTIASLEDQLRYARTAQNLTTDSGDTNITVYETQVENAETALSIAEAALANTKEQADLAVSEGRAQAITYAKLALDSTNAAIKDANEILGINDDNTFSQQYRNALDNISSHIYLVRADIAFRDANNSYEATDEQIDTLTAADSRATIQSALDEVEETLNLTLTLLDEMEALLRLKRSPPDEYETVYDGYLAAYDADQATIAGQLVTIQSSNEGLETTELSADISVENAEAGVESATANLEAAEAGLANIKTQISQSENGASLSVSSLQNQINSAYQSLNVLKAQYSQQISLAEHQVSLSAAQLDSAKIQSETGVIESPMDGVLANFDLKVGETITAGMPVGVMVNTAYFKVEFSVSEFEIPYLTKGDNIELYVDAYPDQTFNAWIYYLSPVPDSTRTYKVKAYISDLQDIPLVSGMSAEVGVRVNQNSEKIVVPLESIRSNVLGDAVFVVEDGVAYERVIEIADIVDGYASISSGLEAGETIVTQGQNLLNDGDRVQILVN